nr:hypothetical protein [Candidatus Sigynarchaeum springense]
MQSENIYKRIGILALPHRVRKKFLGIECWVQSKEDFIIAKLVYAGIQDYKDALSCWLKYKDEIDIAYLTETAENLRVLEYLKALQRGESAEDVFQD